MPIYFARIDGDPADAPVKIGYAKGPATRLMTLQNGHYRDYVFIRVVEGSPTDEARVHSLFQHLRVRGEWFRFDPAMLGDLGMADLPPPVPVPPRLRGAPWSASQRQQVSEAIKRSWAPGGRSRVTYEMQRAKA